MQLGVGAEMLEPTWLCTEATILIKFLLADLKRHQILTWDCYSSRNYSLT